MNSHHHHHHILHSDTCTAAAAANKKRVDKWTDEETYNLIELWQQYDNKLKIRKHRRQTLDEIKSKLYERGISKAIPQINKKLDNLRQEYKKNRVSCTAAIVDGKPPKWRFFEAVHLVLQTNQFYNPDVSASASASGSVLTTGNNNGSTVVNLNVNRKKTNVKRGKKSKRNIDCLLEDLESIVKDIKKDDEEDDETSAKRFREEINESLKQINENIKTIMDTFLAFTNGMIGERRIEQQQQICFDIEQNNAL